MSAMCPTAVPSFRSRIGRDARSGYYVVPRRYRLHLAVSCPQCLQIAVTHSLLGLEETLPVTLLPAVPDAPDGGHQALRPLYEASSHQYAGPAAAPVLSDGWTGRIVSTHTPDILRELAGRFGGGCPDLRPHGAEEAIEAVDRLCEQGITASAQRAGEPGGDPVARNAALGALLGTLDGLDRRLAAQEYVLGGELTLADVQVWVALVQLDTVHRWHLDAAAVHRITGRPHLWAYARRLAAHPAFGSHLDLDGIARRHHARCRGAEAAGAAVQIVDWAAYAPRRATPAR
ncbi:glutathione S-transferase C-terminal domain-containing protein [Streptomyces formicae]|uniref:Glutathione S-transferase C-terminal domain-containing protein n=1 Tax=Streptomyces formicae TaxID=1616117 RepID=A0ABY3WK88_9ACTN|nr:glutathione S-transferase C-terminal domain-containing protein [Streptomyces formicae]UNM12026.1 glutathione S-transferase C-terminal domain-containing protein [Streptomyces formicae]